MEIQYKKLNINNRKLNIVKVAAAVFIVAAVTLFTKFDYFLYDDMIATVISVENEKHNGVNDGRETYYVQNITLKIQNTDRKGTVVTAYNKYFYSQIDSTKYNVGDDLFVAESETDAQDVKILRTKVDTYAVFIIFAFLAVVILIAGKKGILSISTLVVNILIFVLALNNFIKSENIERTTTIVTFFFVVITLVILNGFTKKSLGAILSSLLTVLLVYILYIFVYRFGSRPYFEMMDYIFGNENLEALFLSSVIMGLLGAVMDVSITINSSVYEIVNTAKEPTVQSLIKSVKEISHDIMGTMINVLFFSYLSGSIPMFLIKAKNGYSFLNLVRYDIIFELLRFLLGSIGIVLAIPVSGVIAILLFGKGIKKHAADS